MTDANNMATSSRLGTRISEDAEVGEKMEEAQMESFDEELFNEVRLAHHRLPAPDSQLRAEVLKRANSTIEARSIQFDVGEQSLRFELVDTQKPQESTGEMSSTCDLLVLFARLSFLQALRGRKRRIVSKSAANSRPHLLLSPIVQMLQYSRLAAQVVASLETLQRTLRTAGIDSRVVSQMSLSDPDLINGILENGAVENLGGIITLDISGW